MKTVKKLVPAAVWAAIACLAAPLANAADGDIRSIDRYYGTAAGTDYVTEQLTPDHALSAGQKVMFRFRLLNRTADATYQKRYAGDAAWTNKWDIKYLGSGSTPEEILANAQSPLQVGVWVSGKAKRAKVEKFVVDQESGYWTDMICSYTVEAGDFALPMKLAVNSGLPGNPPAEAGASHSESGYYLYNSDLWGIYDNWKENSSDPNSSIVRSPCNFWLCETPDPDVLRGADRSFLNANYDLTLNPAQAIYIKTISFDDEWDSSMRYDAENWRQISAGTTAAAPALPSLAIPEGVAAGNDSYLYIWTQDENVAEMSNGTEESHTSVHPVTGVSVTRQVSKIKVTPGDKTIPFLIKAKAGAVGSTTKVYLSATPTNVYLAGGVLVTNFVTRQIKVGPPPKPSITVTVNTKASDTVYATPNGSVSVATLNVKLVGGVYSTTEDLEVTVTPEMADSSSTADPFTFIGISTAASSDTGGNPDGVSSNITIYANNESADVPLYIYVKRATSDTSGYGKGIRFKASVADATAQAHFTGENTPATLYIEKIAPEIVSPAEDSEIFNVPGGVEQNIEITIADAPGELSGKYTVKWDNAGNNSWEETPNLTPNSAGVITVPIKYIGPNGGAAWPSKFKVVNQDGYESAVRNIKVWVNAPKKITVSTEKKRYAEGDSADITLNLSEPLGREGFIFAVPQDENSSNLVADVDFERGVKIFSDEVKLEDAFSLFFLDGNTTLRYKFVIKDNENFADGHEIGGFAAGELSLTVSNVLPRVEAVSMSGFEHWENNGTHQVKVAKGVEQTFAIWDLTDPSEIDQTNELFTAQWTFQDGNMKSNLVVSGNPYTMTVPFTFKTPGTNKVSVAVKDKDSLSTPWSKLEQNKFTFFVETLGTPMISMRAHRGSTEFNEDDFGPSKGQIDVMLNIPPSERITVKIDVTNAPGCVGMVPILNTYYVDFDNGSTNATFYIKELDGTPTSFSDGFEFTAAVTNETIAPNSGGKAWKDYYEFDPKGFNIIVYNLDPVIGGSSDTNAVPAALNVPNTIRWSVSDILPDMTNNMRVVWTIQGEDPTNYVINATARTYSENFTFMFTKQGAKIRKVVLDVYDKDDGHDQREYFFEVNRELQVLLFPHWPHPSAMTEFSKDYVSAPGLGAGRVWANGTLSQIDSYKHTWSYDPSDTEAIVYAYGYRAGDEDNGTLKPGKDFGIDVYGDRSMSIPADGWYKWTSAYDSFFYCWLLSTADDSGKPEGTHLGGPKPVVGTNTVNYADQQVGLPEVDEDDDAPLPKRWVEAIFARELYEKDNAGDINMDGIPDIFAVSVKWKSGSKLFEAAGFSLDDGGDLTDISDFNGDEDYLPAATSGGSQLIPNIKSGWALLGTPFTADMEIRGYGAGLNLRSSQEISSQGRYSVGAWISERDFTDVESNAWETVYSLSETWTPENRTDPTVEDTDSDGLPDGYEYYFWYRAYVGDPETGERLTGSKFRLEDIAEGEEIPSDEVARLFNPNVKSSTPITRRDSDGDGLTDLEEFAIGSNPVNWDTDGDGVSDYWEVMRGLDPLVAESTASEKNPDGDYMAWADLGSDYALISFTNADGQKVMYAVANNASGIYDPDEGTLIEAAITNATGIPVFYYGKTGSSLVPVSRGVWASAQKTSMAGNQWKTFIQYTCVEKPTTAVVIDWTGVEDLSTVEVTLDQKLSLVHDQVRAEFGFDPRTAWGRNKNGYVDNRWDPVNNRPHADHLGNAGIAVYTVPYNMLDEYLVLKYRYNTTPNLGFNLAKDKADYAKNYTALAGIFKKGTTNPNVAYSKTYGEYAPTFADENHGADTNGDGVPDGWQLYVGLNPNMDSVDTVLRNGCMTMVPCYAGTDSCNAYADVETIFANHPGTTRGWFNKFWPTDPWNGDTDGDGIRDDIEGGAWDNEIVFSHALDAVGGGGTYKYSFVYNETDGTKPEDDGSLCIRGGGMNPCTVDTDFDCLPDPFEMAFAGILFNAAGQPVGDQLSPAIVEIMRRSDGLKPGDTAVGYYITGGMDATFGAREDDRMHTGDAFTNTSFIDPRTGTCRDFDFDHDGLQNYQEYLVQSLRHLRYDDDSTPLMGRWMPDGVPTTETFLGFLPMNYMDGETFRADAIAAGFTGFTAKDYFRPLGYFARPPREWDPLGFLDFTLMTSQYDGATGGYRVMLAPQKNLGMALVPALSYASTDPRNWDSDGDNMDDFYELFHGLNPLLGSVADPMVVDGDVISMAYGGNALAISALNNGWVGWCTKEEDLPRWGDDTAEFPYFDPIKYPWMMGTPEADADGDGIRNGEEALHVNITSPQPTHTDPTPLWLTDSTALNKASYTSQYYARDLDLALYPWVWTDGRIRVDDTQTMDGAIPDYLFSFEENEGYDTDGDGIPDGEEQRVTSTPTSDPLLFTDPDRRQALWFPGENSAAVSRAPNIHRLNYQSYDTFRQFTVEAWIKPEVLDREQVILERAAMYGATTMSNNMARVRANFRLGITAEGKLYGLFDTNDAVPSGEGASKIVGLKLTTDWTHVALKFDGAALRLYMNGKMVGEPVLTSQIPANGLTVFNEEAVPGSAYFPVVKNGYTSVPCAMVLGAQALTGNAIEISKDTKWTDYGSFYQGYIDEVRVWDGARKDADLWHDYAKRYLFSDVADLRDAVYTAWVAGATRNDNDGQRELPAELVLHYSFQALPGAVNAADVAWEPSGFTKNVQHNAKVETWNVPGDIYCGWWYEAANVRSTVYRNWRIVPWIQNMASHLPAKDGSTADSQYWSERYGGMTSATDAGVEKFAFPNSACVYPGFQHMMDLFYRKDRVARLNQLGVVSDDVYYANQFDLRTAIVGTSDLVPLGGAFAKRIDEMWDGEGPADATMMTGRDNNANGIPDWWESVAMINYGAAEGFGWESPVTYGGKEMSAREAYLRDIQKGMQPDGSTNGSFANRADADKDGLPDWWENLHGLLSEDGYSDNDSDGLSNYAEFLLSEKLGSNYPSTSATMAQTFEADGQKVPDYFLRAGDAYLGFLFADHDFMEDVWEDQFDSDKLSRITFDAWTDPDDDGWSNWAECRAATDPLKNAYLGVEETTMKAFPVPSVQMTVAYGGDMPMGPLVVQAWHSGDAAGRPDAVWKLATDESDTTVSASSDTNTVAKSAKLIGMNPRVEQTLMLGPGSVVPGSVQVLFKDIAYYQVIALRRYDNASNLVNEVVTSKTLGTASGSSWVIGVQDRLRTDDQFKGDMMAVSLTEVLGKVGTIDYTTGEITIDFSSLNYEVQYDSSIVESERYYKTCNLANSYVKIAYTSLVPQQGFPITVSLGDPEDPSQVDSLGRLREGSTLFSVFLDSDGSGTWTPGEPYGVATGVDVGWSTTSFTVELTDIAAQLARFDLLNGIAATDFASANVLTDRGVAGQGEPNVEAAFVGTNTPAATRTRVRVVRSYINGSDLRGGSPVNGVVMDATYNLVHHPTLTEIDVRAAGKLDLDWGTLLDTWGSGSISALTNVAYRLVLGDGTVDPYEYNNNYPVLFVNKFERGTEQKAATLVYPKGIVFGGQPTFRWKHSNTIGKAYPAFRLRVWTAKTGGSAIYDSGALPAPARDSTGTYSWTAPIYANMVTPKGAVFSTTNNYYWSVSMLDAKFTVPNSSETRQEFRMEASGALGTVGDYGAIRACVRYFGPSAVSAKTTSLTNIVRVQAFTSPDFTGMPAGEAYVTNVAGIASTTDLTPNALILGAKPGRYYLRAFVDANGNGSWQRWETWGYLNYVGDPGAPFVTVSRGGKGKYSAVAWRYTPQSVTVEAGESIPEAVIFMEDMDTDIDGLPDAWEWAKNGYSLDKRGPRSGNTYFTRLGTDFTATKVAPFTEFVGSGTLQMPVSLMSTILAGGDAADDAALLLGGAANYEPPAEDIAIRIASFSLEGGISLAVTTEVPEDTSGVYVVAGTADVLVSIVAAKTPDFADAVEVPVKTITIRSNAKTEEAISAAEVKAALDAAKVDNAAFLKVKISQE